MVTKLVSNDNNNNNSFKLQLYYNSPWIAEDDLYGKSIEK